MANTSFASGTLALASLKANGFKPRDTALRGDVADADLLLAAQIAVFLCNKSQFDQQLRIVSEQMWKFYRALDPNEKNKFSRALSLVAEPFGFITSTRVAPDATRGVAMQLKLVGGDPELGYMLSRGMFWKDSMHNRHGEFTHSLQWLAIANKFGRNARTLYTRLGTYQAKTKDGKTAYLWQWLADCFPSDMRAEAGDTVLKNDETLESQTFRSPQVITDYLVRQMSGALKGHFISGYLHMRYNKRSWLAPDKVDKEGNKLTLRKLSGDAIGNAEKKKADGQWKNSTRPGATGEARWVRDAAHDGTPVVPRAADTLVSHDVTFHGEKGKLYESA